MNMNDTQLHDAIVDTARRRARNDPVFRGMIALFRNEIENGMSELDIVAAANIAAGEVEERRREEMLRRGWETQREIVRGMERKVNEAVSRGVLGP